MKRIVSIRKVGKAFDNRPHYAPNSRDDVSCYEDGMGEVAFDVVASQKAILREHIKAGCIVN